MADINTIKAQLQQTSKGKLKYDSKSWNQIFDETTKQPKVHLSPFQIKNSSRIETTIRNQRDNDEFKVIFTFFLTTVVKNSIFLKRK